MNEFQVGDKAILKVGRIEVTVEIMRPMGNGAGYWVRNLTNGKEFIMPGSRLSIPTVSVEPVQETPAPAPEKKLSLMDASVEVLKATGKAMTTREMVKTATEMGVWKPTACRTPEQTLYGSIFREIKTKEQPRIVRADEKGKFRLA